MNTKKILPVATIIASTLLFSACIPEQKNENQTEVQQNQDTSTNSQQPKTAEQQSIENSVQPNSETQKNVSVETTYTSPAGEEPVAFTITIDEAGVITDAQTEVLATAPTSVFRQNSFAAELPSVLKGKKLSELNNIDRIGGSSLTTKAFNEALDDLKAQL